MVELEPRSVESKSTIKGWMWRKLLLTELNASKNNFYIVQNFIHSYSGCSACCVSPADSLRVSQMCNPGNMVSDLLPS